MFVLTFDPSIGKYRSTEIKPPRVWVPIPPRADALPPIWPSTPEWYPKDDRYRGEP